MANASSRRHEFLSNGDFASAGENPAIAVVRTMSGQHAGQWFVLSRATKSKPKIEVRQGYVRFELGRGDRLVQTVDKPRGNVVLGGSIRVVAGQLEVSTPSTGDQGVVAALSKEGQRGRRITLTGTFSQPVERLEFRAAIAGTVFDVWVISLTVAPAQVCFTAPERNRSGISVPNQPFNHELEPMMPTPTTVMAAKAVVNAQAARTIVLRDAVASLSDSATPPPLIAFDPNGKASVVSFQVPEPTSYTGNHVLSLRYQLSDFASLVPSPASVSPNDDPNDVGAPNQTAFLPKTAKADTTRAQSVIANIVVVPSVEDSLLVPASVLLNANAAGASVIRLAPFDRTDRLNALTWDDVALVAATSRRVEVYRSIGGQLDYRIRQAPAATTSAETAAPDGIRPANTKVGGPPPNDNEPLTPYLSVSITSPGATNTILAGPWNGLSLTVAGHKSAYNAGDTSVRVDLTDSTGKVVSSQTAGSAAASSDWQASFDIRLSGQYTIRANGSASASGVRIVGSTSSIDVQLAEPPANPPVTPPAIVPTVVITNPTSNMGITDLDGTVQVTVAGSADPNGGSAVSVSFSIDGDDATGVTLAGDGTFQTSGIAVGFGAHSLSVMAVNADGNPAPSQTITFFVQASQPAQPIERRLFLIEKLAITSFLGDFGTSRVVQTVSLLPGEQTTISVDSYTKTDTTSKTASSILDSSSTEAAADFEDTVNDENENSSSNQDKTDVGVAAKIGAQWGWGDASISANYSNEANASTANTVKTLNNSLQKHTSKASSNRTMSVNSDFSSNVLTGTTTDTTRTLKNINVSRVLNFVFRQLTQQHQVLISLVDATIGYYAQDVLLDGAGKPIIGADGGPLVRESYRELSLPEVSDFATSSMTGTAGANLVADVVNLLSTIPDYQGNERPVVEWITPTAADGTPVATATYLRIKPDLAQTFTDLTGAQFTVPGIILSQSSYVLRTDQLLCDALLGQGDALDEYSHALQEVTISERQAAVAATAAATARELLAQQIVSAKDSDAAGVWQKIYPQPLSVPATINIPAAASAPAINATDSTDD
jgi:hypothetical protein